MKKKRLLRWHQTFRLVGSAARSPVAQNAVSLYAIQFANYVLPLVTVPYLVRVLGPAKFGVVAFCQSLIGFFVLFVDYGFAFSATRKISIERNDRAAVSRIVFNVWGAKIILACTGIVILLLLVTLIQKLSEVASLLIVLYASAIGNVLMPIWLFQGMEKMIAISVINLATHFAVAVGIFTLVHRPEDYLLYAGLTSFGFMGAGLVGAVAALILFKLPLVFPSWRGVWKELVEGWMLFLSSASISLYTVGNAFILGILTNHTVVGYYRAGEKIVRTVSGLLDPIPQAAYPRFSRMASDSKTLVLQWGSRILLLMGGLGGLLSIALFIGAPAIVRIILGPEYEPSIMVIRILALVPLFVGVGTVLGRLTMLPFKRDKERMVILVLAGLANLAMAALFVPSWRESGMALAVVTAEALVTFSFLFYLRANRLSPIGRIVIGNNEF